MAKVSIRMLAKIMGGLVSLGAGECPGVFFSYTMGVDWGGRTRKEENVDGRSRRQRGERTEGRSGRREGGTGSRKKHGKGVMRTVGRKLQLPRSSQAGKHDQTL